MSTEIAKRQVDAIGKLICDFLVNNSLLPDELMEQIFEADGKFRYGIKFNVVELGFAPEYPEGRKPAAQTAGSIRECEELERLYRLT